MNQRKEKAKWYQIQIRNQKNKIEMTPNNNTQKLNIKFRT